MSLAVELEIPVFPKLYFRAFLSSHNTMYLVKEVSREDAHEHGLQPAHLRNMSLTLLKVVFPGLSTT